ncbi:LysR family transcriptional regulator [Colwellia psychrerythraea]|uniref:Transcriptional regulator, LysR family n=1 Tax=Colwellia psychrerythraea TaxID=28229 RepID=A0A099L014_COLPS|nr:LysR family transcriptional regulator [Colwellia psychrerythraea]KGJ96181.1 transcriptional regulator, LysR family [Colwellia psychrerythraea]
MKDTSWDDYKIAYQVAIDGSLSKAGISLRINHATVLRRINQLEQSLEVKLFIRHQRGYKLTDAGFLLMDEMPEILAKFSSLENKLQNVEGDISGELRITTVSSFSPVITPILKAFRDEYPKIRLKLISTDDIVPLDSGAAHVSLRAGPSPAGVDLIVKKLTRLTTSYYATQKYVDKYGKPNSPEQFNEHIWALPTPDKYRIPFVSYVVDKIDKDRIAFQSNHFPDIHEAVIAGMGIGPLGEHQVEMNPTMVKMDFDIPNKDESIWFVYHKDLQNSVRIQCFYLFLTQAIGQ